MRRAHSLIPALLRFPASAARQDGWGRLLTVTAGGAELSTGVSLARGESLIVEFELGGAPIRLSARVHHRELDGDGHELAELRWTDPVERRAAARALLDVLSRA